MGCQRCRTACFIEHSRSKTLMGAIEEAITGETPPWSNMHIRKVGVMAVPTSCHHCPAAVCMAVCPTGALHREGPGEPVLVDNTKCVGCESCVIVCPYGVPELTPDHSHIHKCDQCADRMKEGRLPACVEACPTGCLSLVVEDEEEGQVTEEPISAAGICMRALETFQKAEAEQ